MGEKYPGEDIHDYLKNCNSQKEIDEMHDRWDLCYGIYPLQYEVYLLLDGTKPGDYIFGPLTFTHEPFYVGYGSLGRHRKSAGFGRQLDRYNFKVEKMKEIIKKGGTIRCVILNRFYTKNKAMLVEKKLMNLIPRPPLTNSMIHLCKVPLKPEDYQCMNKSFLLTC